MERIHPQTCPNCGTPLPENGSPSIRADGEDILVVQYDPKIQTIILKNTGSGAEQVVQLSSQGQPKKPASRQIAGIIGPF